MPPLRERGAPRLIAPRGTSSVTIGERTSAASERAEATGAPPRTTCLDGEPKHENSTRPSSSSVDYAAARAKLRRRGGRRRQRAAVCEPSARKPTIGGRTAALRSTRRGPGRAQVVRVEPTRTSRPSRRGARHRSAIVNMLRTEERRPGALPIHSVRVIAGRYRSTRRSVDARAMAKTTAEREGRTDDRHSRIRAGTRGRQRAEHRVPDVLRMSSTLWQLAHSTSHPGSSSS